MCKTKLNNHHQFTGDRFKKAPVVVLVPTIAKASSSAL